MYTEYYGLSGRPFQLTPDPAFYFDSQTHRKAMAYLGYGLAQGEGFIVITGDIGAGKTTLVGHLMATIDRARLTAVRLVSTQVDGDDMLRLAAQALGLVTENVVKAQLLDRVERFLHEQVRGGRRTLLIVDEAQNLPVSALEELRMLSNFQSGGQALVQIFLLGQPEFREKLKSERLEQLRQRVIATHHLEPMRADEVGPYIEHRLSLVGWRDDPRFTPDAFAVLYRHSGGVPRTLNMLASRLLLLGALERRGLLDGEAVESVIEDMARDTVDPADVTPAPTPKPAPAPAAQQQAGPVSAAPSLPPVASPVDPAAHAALVERLAAMEARVEEQEVALRRVLTLLIDWVESDTARMPDDARRTNAA